MHVVAVVPARGGSKGIVGKNLRALGGESLVRRAVRCGLETTDAVVVSSDDADILREGEAAGASVDVRPASLATDEAGVEAVLVELLTRVTADAIVVLQPTSPLRTAEDVRACLDALTQSTTAATVSPLGHPVEWTFRLDASGRLVPLLGWEGLRRRQDLAQTYQLNGAVYAAMTEHLRDGGRLVDEGTHAVVMPPERSVDIDTELDLKIATALLEPPA